MRQFPNTSVFVPEEWRTHEQSQYMDERLQACLPPEMYNPWKGRYILNCGLWGGRREPVMEVLRLMMLMYYDMISGALASDTCFTLGVDMVVFNHVLYTTASVTTREGMKLNEPLCPVYRNCHFVYHVADASREVDVYAPACNQPLPTRIGAELTMEESDNYARHVCTAMPPQDVRCATLPFAMIHKGSVTWN